MGVADRPPNVDFTRSLVLEIDEGRTVGSDMMNTTEIRQFSILSAALSLSLIMMAPASADEPIVITPPPNVFVGVDPCTGDLHGVSIYFTVFVHTDHNNNIVIHLDRTGFTDSGYEMFAGQGHQVVNTGVLTFSLTDMWINEDGRMFQATERVLVNFEKGEVIYDEFRARCIGDETVI
jgi:hypothetical protein